METHLLNKFSRDERRTHIGVVYVDVENQILLGLIHDEKIFSGPNLSVWVDLSDYISIFWFATLTLTFYYLLTSRVYPLRLVDRNTLDFFFLSLFLVKFQKFRFTSR